MTRAVPYAMDGAGQLAVPALVASGGSYTCLECHEPVSLVRAHLRRGREVRAHFTHRKGGQCAGESVLHLAAKMQLVATLQRRDATVLVQRQCARWCCEETTTEPLVLPEYDEVRAEVPLSTFRLDVALLRDGVVVFGFEVYHRHRVDRAKAAGLTVPWMEVQAAPAAATPMRLVPHRELGIDGDDEVYLRARLQAKRGMEDMRFREVIQRAGDLQVFKTYGERPWVVAAQALDAYSAGGSTPEVWHCDPCREIRQTFHEHRAREARAAEEARLRGLAEQRPIFGPNMIHPFDMEDVSGFQRDAATFRFAVQYLRHPPEALLTYFLGRPYESLVACRCWRCRRAILCIEIHEYYSPGAIYDGLLEYFHPPQRFRGVYVSKCRYCGSRQRMSSVYRQPHVVLEAWRMEAWLKAFVPRP